MARRIKVGASFILLTLHLPFFPIFRDKPSGVMIPTHLKVLTIVERPFIYIRNKTFGVSCEEEREDEGWVECPEHVDSPGVGASFCCRGYCMDLLEELSKTSNFTYSLHVSLRGDYGNLERNNDTGKQVGRTETTCDMSPDPCIARSGRG